MYEDSMNLIIDLPIIASYIFQKGIQGGASCHLRCQQGTGAANYAAMLGFDNAATSTDLMRFFLTIHTDPVKEEMHLHIL